MLFTETGTEGGWWAMQEDGFARSDGHWMYEGIRYHEEGDDFTVYAEDGSVLFHGIIHQDSRTGAIPRQVIRNGKLVNDPTWKQQFSGACGFIGFRKASIPRFGANCSLATSGAS